MEKKDIEEGKGLAWLSYLGIFILIPLLVQKDNPYTKFHIKQGLILLIISFGWSFIWVFFMFIPFLRVIIWLLSYVVYLFIFVLMIIGIVNSLKGKIEFLPLIGKYGEKIKI
ncbi:hypothetical protein J7K25_07280 [bacterium]|nr:hypothetical protein [bacterium]